MNISHDVTILCYIKKQKFEMSLIQAYKDAFFSENLEDLSPIPQNSILLLKLDHLTTTSHTIILQKNNEAFSYVS